MILNVFPFVTLRFFFCVIPPHKLSDVGRVCSLRRPRNSRGGVQRGMTRWGIPLSWETRVMRIWARTSYYGHPGSSSYYCILYYVLLLRPVSVSDGLGGWSGRSTGIMIFLVFGGRAADRVSSCNWKSNFEIRHVIIWITKNLRVR